MLPKGTNIRNFNIHYNSPYFAFFYVSDEKVTHLFIVPTNSHVISYTFPNGTTLQPTMKINPKTLISYVDWVQQICPKFCQCSRAWLLIRRWCIGWSLKRTQKNCCQVIFVRDKLVSLILELVNNISTWIIISVTTNVYLRFCYWIKYKTWISMLPTCLNGSIANFVLFVKNTIIQAWSLVVWKIICNLVWATNSLDL